MERLGIPSHKANPKVLMISGKGKVPQTLQEAKQVTWDIMAYVAGSEKGNQYVQDVSFKKFEMRDGTPGAVIRVLLEKEEQVQELLERSSVLQGTPYYLNPDRTREDRRRRAAPANHD